MDKSVVEIISDAGPEFDIDVTDIYHEFMHHYCTQSQMHLKDIVNAYIAWRLRNYPATRDEDASLEAHDSFNKLAASFDIYNESKRHMNKWKITRDDGVTMRGALIMGELTYEYRKGPVQEFFKRSTGFYPINYAMNVEQSQT